MAAEAPFELFGDRRTLAIEIALLPQPQGIGPADNIGSWGAWRLWVADQNLCDLELDSRQAHVGIAEVRWFLAPLFRWIISAWMPLLHEGHLPPGGRWGDSRPRWSRLAYLSMIESDGDNQERFGPWQDWAKRHALRTAADGGIVPDVFFQRRGDEIEISWGDRVQPGSEDVTFLAEDGVARVLVDEFAETFQAATSWFVAQPAAKSAPWGKDLRERWAAIRSTPAGESALAWYLDARSEPGPLTQTFRDALTELQRPLPSSFRPWWGRLAPEVAMFGDISPDLSKRAAVKMLAAYFDARCDPGEREELSRLVADEPAWIAASPWNNGYALASDVLEVVEPDTALPSTDIEAIIRDLGIQINELDLGDSGPRGVALAGDELRPTILVNRDAPVNQGRGRRFTLAHEFCHILFDRDRTRSLIHSSTPWTSPAVEQRANAFAAMLLMPPTRARRPAAKDFPALKRAIELMADRLGVSRVALKQHLANTGEITPFERDRLLGQPWNGDA